MNKYKAGKIIAAVSAILLAFLIGAFFMQAITPESHVPDSEPCPEPEYKYILPAYVDYGQSRRNNYYIFIENTHNVTVYNIRLTIYRVSIEIEDGRQIITRLSPLKVWIHKRICPGERAQYNWCPPEPYNEYPDGNPEAYGDDDNGEE